MRANATLLPSASPVRHSGIPEPTCFTVPSARDERDVTPSSAVVPDTAERAMDRGHVEFGDALLTVAMRYRDQILDRRELRRGARRTLERRPHWNRAVEDPQITPAG